MRLYGRGGLTFPRQPRTVPYNSKHPDAHTPYFQITDAEIVGAMGAKIAPP